jgi:hypothetical protein
MTLSGAFFFGPITLLMLFVSGTPLTIANFPLYVAGGLGTIFWVTLAGAVSTVFTGR